MAHSCRWRFPARPGGNTISGSWRRAGRVRVTAALRTVTDTHPNTNGLGLGFDAALQVSAAIGNNLQKFRAVLGETSGSSSGEEEEFCGFGAINEHRRTQSSPRPLADKTPPEKKPRGRPRRTPIPSQEKLQENDRPAERPSETVNGSPERPLVSVQKRRGRPPRSAQRGKAGAGEHRGGGQPVRGRWACSQNVPEGERESQWGTPRDQRFHRTKVQLKSSLRVVGRKGVAVPVAPRRRRGRPPSAERLRAGVPGTLGSLGAHMGVGPTQKTLGDFDLRIPPQLKLRSTQPAGDASDSACNSPPVPAVLRRVLGVRQSPRHVKPARLVPPARRSDAAIAKQLLQRAKKGVAVRGCPGGPGRDRAMRRRWTQLKNIRQFRMPVVSTISMRVIKTPKRFIEDETGFRAPPPHAKMARLDAAPLGSLPASPASAVPGAPASAGTAASLAPLAPPFAGSAGSGAVSQHSSRSSSPSLDSSSEAQSPPPPPPLPPRSERGRTVTFGRGRRGRRRCLISPATGLLRSCSSQQASAGAPPSSLPPPPLLAPPHPLQSTAPASAVGERHPHHHPAWVMPHPMAPFLPPPPVLAPLQDQQRSILRQPTFRWTSAVAPRQCFSSAKYAKEGLIRKPVFDNFQPPPLTAQDVGLLPPCGGVGAGATFTVPRGSAMGAFFPPLPHHHHLPPSSRFGVPLHKLRPALHKLRPLLRAPRFTPSEAHSRIFESVTIPRPRAASLSELRAQSLTGQGVRRRRRGQPRSPSHSMTTRSSQSGAQVGKGPLQPGSSIVSPVPTRALTPASFGSFMARPTSLSTEPAAHRPSSSSSSSPLLMFASSLGAASRGLGLVGKEKASSLPQETLAKEKEAEEHNEEESKGEVEKECERRGVAVVAGGVTGLATCPLTAGDIAAEEPPLCTVPKNSFTDSSEDPPSSGLGHKAFADTSPACPTLRVQPSKYGKAADRADEEEEDQEEEEEEGEDEEAEEGGEEEEEKEERANPPFQPPPAPTLDPALAPEGRPEVTGLLKKAKAPLCKMEKSRSLKPTEPPKAQDFVEMPGRGPRIKHVCRRAAVALGRNRAVFPDDLPTLSALPWEERENILSSMGNDDKSSVAGSEEAEAPVPHARPAMRPRSVPDSPARAGRRSRRCGQCAGCQVPDDCGVCANCLDKPKFGGRNIKKQCCKERKCQNLQWMPAKMFLQKPGKAKKDKKEKPMFDKKDSPQAVKTPPSEGNPKLTLKEEPAHGETPPLKNSEQNQPQPPPPSAPGPAAAHEPKQHAPPLQQPSPPPSPPPPQPTQPPPQKGGVTSPPGELKETPQLSNMGSSPTEAASEVKPTRKPTPGFPLPEKNKAKEKEKQPTSGRSLTWLSTPSPGGAAGPGARCDGARGLQGGFREDCDVERVWQAGGLSVLASLPIKPLTLCLLCASSGNLEFVFCQVCCEPFHLFCLGEAERPLQQQRENWCCRRCRFCQACGQQDQRSKQQLLECEKCGNSYHPECLGPKHPRRPTKKNRVWICTRCVCCKSCGSTSPGKAADAQWSHDFSLCQDCAKLFVKGNFCPLCDKCYDDDDYESKMMQCGRCARWVHARCESLTDEMYEILSKLPESVAYTCTSCTQRPPAEWRTALERELQSSVRRVLTALLNSRTSAHLLHCATAVMKLPELSPESKESPPSLRPPEGPDPPILRQATPSNASPPDLESVKRKMESGGYSSVLEFSDDVVKIIQAAISCDGGQPESRKANSMVKAYFSRQMERVFPWFQVKESRFWQPQKASPSSELLPDSVLPPSLDHNYAQCQERDGTLPTERPLLMKKIIPAPRIQGHGEPDPPTSPSPAPTLHLPDFAQGDSPEVVPPPGLNDSRQCVLCLKFGDDNPNDAGRLLYIGRNEWTHVNCALWSAEVFEDDDGTLKNVHMAVANGKQLRCELCKRSGATVCCCVSGCSCKFHFMCARRQHCVFLEDKRMYCLRHHNLIKGEVVSESGFGVTRRILVDFEGVNLRRKFLSGVDPESVRIMIGSMTIDCLGTLTELSDFENHLFPIGYQCSRVYWSTVDARRHCVYTFRILASGPVLVDPVSEMELSLLVDPVESLVIPPKPKASIRNGEHNHTFSPSPCPGPLPSAGALADFQKQRITSSGHCDVLLSQKGPFSSALSLSIPHQHPEGAREMEGERGPAVETLSGEALTSVPGIQRKQNEGVPPKRENRRADGKLPEAEDAVAGSTLKEPAPSPLGTVVMRGVSRSNSCKPETREQCGRGTESPCLTSSHSIATIPKSNLVKDTNRNKTMKDYSRSNSMKDTSKHYSANTASRGHSVKDSGRGNSIKDPIRSHLGKDARRSNFEKDACWSNSVKDTPRSNSEKDASRSDSVMDSSWSNSEKDTSQSVSVKDASRSKQVTKDVIRNNSMKDANRSASMKDTSKTNSVKDASRTNTVKDASGSSSVKDASRSTSVKDTGRSNSVKDACRSTLVKDACRSNSVKDTRRSNSVKDTSRSNSVKDTSRSNSVKDTSGSKPVKKDPSRNNYEKDACRSNPVKDVYRGNSQKDASRSNSVKDASRSNPEKDSCRGKSVKDVSRSNSEKDASRIKSEKNTSRVTLVKDARRSTSEKDASRGDTAKHAGRGDTAKHAGRGDSGKDARNSVKDRSSSVDNIGRGNLGKHASSSDSMKEASRSNSVNDGHTNNTLKDTCRSNSSKDAGRSNSVKGASRNNTVKGTSSCNSEKDAGRSNSIKDAERINCVKVTNRSNSVNDRSRSILLKDARRNTLVKENSMSKSVNNSDRNDLMKDTSPCNLVKDMTRSNLVRDTSLSNLGKERNSKLAQATEGAMKPGPQTLNHKAAVKMSHEHLSKPASRTSNESTWSMEATVEDATWQRSEDLALTVAHRISSTRERSSNVRASSSVDVTVRDGQRNMEEVSLKSEARGIVDIVLKKSEKKNTAGNRQKISGTLGKEKHPDHTASSNYNQRNCTSIEELKLRSELERGLRASQFDEPKLGKEFSQKERKQWDLEKTHLRTDPNEFHTLRTSPSTLPSPSLSAAPHGLLARSSSLLVFSSTSTSPESSESESEHHLPPHHREDEKGGPEEGEEDGSAADENHEEDSDESGSAKRRYPRRSARARSNMFFGLTPFYGVRSYGDEDVPFHCHGETGEQKQAGDKSIMLPAKEQMDRAGNVSSSSSDESEEDEETIGECPKKDALYYNFTRTILSPNVERYVGGIPELRSYLKKEAGAKETKREELGGLGNSLGQPKISQLDGVDDGSESDASLSATGMNTSSTPSASKKSTRKRKAREGRVEQERPEKQDESGSSGNSGGRGNNVGRSRSRKNQKESALSLGSGKSQGQGSLDTQLSLSTELLKSDSDNTNSDDCGNILPSDIMEFVLNTPSMQALDQQPESSSSQLLSLDEGFSLDGNRGKDMSLFEDFPQQLPTTTSAESRAPVPGDEPFLPLELPSDLSVLTTRSSSVTSQNPQPNQPEPTSHPIISLPTDDSTGEKASNKQTGGNIVASENQQGGLGVGDPQAIEGHITPGHMDANLITSPPTGEVIGLPNREGTGTSGTPGLQGLQKQKYVPASTSSSGSTQVATTAVQPTHLKPGTENLIVVNQHLQPLYVLQTCSGVTQKIQIAPSVTTAAVIDTRSSLISSMTGGLALTAGLHPGIPAPQSMFPPGSKGPIPISHHPQIHTFTGTAQTGCQPIPSTSSSLLIGVHPNDPRILVSEAGQHPGLAPSAIVSCSSSIPSSAQSKKRPISRLQPRRSRKLARTQNQPSNMTLINLSPMQITTGIPAQPELVELGTPASAAATQHRKVPNIIKRPKSGVMYFEPPTLLSHGVSVSGAQPVVLGHESPAQLLPCTVSGLNPNQPVLNVLSVPAGSAGSLLNTSTLTTPISGLLLKASQQSMGLPDHQMILQSGAPIIPQLNNTTQTSIASSICMLPPTQLTPHQALSISQGAQQLQHHPANKIRLPDHSTSAQSSVLLSPDRVSSQGSQTKDISRTADQQHASKTITTVGAAPPTGKGKQKGKRTRHSSDEAGGKKRKAYHADHPHELPGEPDQGSCSSSSSGLRAPMDTEKPKRQEVQRVEMPQNNSKSTALDPQKKGGAQSSSSERRLLFEISSDDGFHVRSETIEEAWKFLTDKVQEARMHVNLRELCFQGANGLRMLGLVHDAVIYFVEQLRGARHCRNHRFRFHKPAGMGDPPINPHGSARVEQHHRKSLVDMFNFLASEHRHPPPYQHQEEEEVVHPKSARRGSNMDLPLPMRLRRLKKASRKALGVYRSAIHGRGLFCRRNIEVGEMVIEYSGTVIRSVLAEKRQRCYEGKGIGSYMFRIDDYEVVDATMHGNAARFINHSCEPNCFSRVINIQGHKRIIIFALRNIYRGEEITYDYKFPTEAPGHKLPCNCGAKACRKFLN